MTPAVQLARFMAKYAPGVARDGKAVLTRMRKLMPGAVELVYDNYQWLVVGFGPNERASDAVLSVVFAPRWISICFLQDAPSLPDPDRLLRGSGNVVRNIRLESPRDLDRPAVRTLMRAALSRADVAVDRKARRRMVIKSVSAKQRPRRPR